MTVHKFIKEGVTNLGDQKVRPLTLGEMGQLMEKGSELGHGRAAIGLGALYLNKNPKTTVSELHGLLDHVKGQDKLADRAKRIFTWRSAQVGFIKGRSPTEVRSNADSIMEIARQALKLDKRTQDKVFGLYSAAAYEKDPSLNLKGNGKAIDALVERDYQIRRQNNTIETLRETIKSLKSKVAAQETDDLLDHITTGTMAIGIPAGMQPHLR